MQNDKKCFGKMGSYSRLELTYIFPVLFNTIFNKMMLMDNELDGCKPS
jgi:hypothetical protein